MTATLTPPVPQTITLKKPTTFRAGWRTRILPPGTQVHYSRTETETTVLHVARIEMNGETWESEISVEKPPQSAPEPTEPPAPSLPAPQSAPENTATETAYGIARTIAKQDRTGEAAARLDRLDRALSGRVYLFTYDIPDRLKDECPNPSDLLKPIGYRINLSCWVVTEQVLQGPIVKGLQEHWDSVPAITETFTLDGIAYEERIAVSHHAILFDASQLSKMREMARDQLAKELRNLHRSLIERIDRAADTLQKARNALEQAESGGTEVTEKDRERAENAYLNAFRAAVRDSITDLEAAIECAEIYDDLGSLPDLIAGVRAAVNSHRHAFNGLARDRQRKEIPPPPF